MSRPTRMAFVVSGGASLDAIQVGMLRPLSERGVAPDLIVGTSAGPINGAFIASRPQRIETADALGDVWRGPALLSTAAQRTSRRSAFALTAITRPDPPGTRCCSPIDRGIDV